MVEVALEFRLDVARILALRNRDDSFDDHRAHLHLVVNDRLELVAHRQEQQIREGNAVHRRYEGRGNSLAELRRIGEMFHDGHQSHDRADDPERRRIYPHAFENLGGLHVEMLDRVEFDLHAGSNRLRFAAVDERLKPFFKEVVLFLFDRGLQSQQSLLAGDVAPFDDFFDHRRRVIDRRLEHPDDDPPRAQERRQARLHQARRKRAENDDDERRAADQGAGAAAFQDGAADDRYQREKGGD